MPRSRLCPTEREEIARLYAGGGWSVRALGKKFGVGHGTIHRLVAEIEKPDNSIKVSEVQAPDPISVPRNRPTNLGSLSALDFQRRYIDILVDDLQYVRERGSVNVLAPLHKLVISTHSAIVALEAEESQDIATMSADGLLSTLTGTISKLPPILRHRILDHLEAMEEGRIIDFPAASDEA